MGSVNSSSRPGRKRSVSFHANHPSSSDLDIQKASPSSPLHGGDFDKHFDSNQQKPSPDGFDDLMEQYEDTELPIDIESLVTGISNLAIHEPRQLTESLNQVHEYCYHVLRDHERLLQDNKDAPQFNVVKRLAYALHFAVLEYGSKLALEKHLALFRSFQTTPCVFSLFFNLTKTLCMTPTFPLQAFVPESDSITKPIKTKQLKQSLYTDLAHQFQHHRVEKLLDLLKQELD